MSISKAMTHVYIFGSDNVSFKLRVHVVYLKVSEWTCVCYKRELRAYIRESFRKEDCYYNSQVDVFRKQRCLGDCYGSSDLNLGRIDAHGMEANN